MKYSPDSILPEEATTVTNEILDHILNKDLEKIKSLSDERLLEVKELDGVFKQLFDYLPKTKENNVALVYAEIRQNDTSEDHYPIYLSQYEIPVDDEYLVLTLYLNDQGDCCLFQHIKFKSYKVQPSTYNDFTFKNKALRHYIFFSLLILMPIFTIITLVSCVRNKNLRKKWLWFIFIILGFYGLTLNWTTGEIGNDFITATKTGEKSDTSYHLNLFSFQVMGAGFLKSGNVFSAWVITISFPLGAIIYWWRELGRSRREAKEIADKF